MCKERYLNPFTDYGFKHLFGTEANKENLIKVLNALIDCPDAITDITFLNPQKLGIDPSYRSAIYDIYCTTESGSHIIVEMQNVYQTFFLDRSIYYSTFPLQESAKKGQWNFNLPPIYTVAFLNFEMEQFEDDPEPRHVVRLCDVKSGKEFYGKLTYIYVEMPKVVKELHELESNVDFWLYVIKNMNDLDEVPEELVNQGFENFFNTAEIPNFSRAERYAYEESLKRMRDYTNGLTTAEEKGRAEGRAEGREEGIEIGMEKGEKKERERIAEEMRKQGFSEEMITRLIK